MDANQSKAIVAGMQATLAKMTDAQLVEQVIETKVASGEPRLFAQTLGDELKKRLKVARLKSLKETLEA